jgi:hypothetical protein
MFRLRNILVGMVALATFTLLPADVSSHPRKVPVRSGTVVISALTKVVIVKRQKRIWVPGHWRWSARANRYVWVKGHYVWMK